MLLLEAVHPPAPSKPGDSVAGLPGVAKEKSRSTAKSTQSSLMSGEERRSQHTQSKAGLARPQWAALEILGFIEGFLIRAAWQEEERNQSHLQRCSVCFLVCAMSPRPAAPTAKVAWRLGPCSSRPHLPAPTWTCGCDAPPPNLPVGTQRPAPCSGLSPFI